MIKIRIKSNDNETDIRKFCCVIDLIIRVRSFMS